MSDLTMAVSEEAVNETLQVLLDEDVTTFENEASGEFGAFSAGYEVGGHFALDAIDFRNEPDRVLVDELDVIYDTLRFWLDVDIPEQCIGGGCVVPGFGGCAVRAPEKCLFESESDIHVPVDASGRLRSEVSGMLAPTVNYRNNRRHRDYLDAQVEQHRRLQNRPNDASGPLEDPPVDKWEVSFHPATIDIDLIDIADVVGDLLEDAFASVMDDLLGGLPGWARDVIQNLFGSFVDLVRTVLDIPDDIGEWLSNLIGVSLDLEGFLIEVLDNFFVDYPAVGIEDPYPVLDWDPSLGKPPEDTRTIPVKVPIEELSVDVATSELVLQADIGGY